MLMSWLYKITSSVQFCPIAVSGLHDMLVERILKCLG